MGSDEQLIKYGEPLRYDKNFKGPLQKRSCTDVICLLIFIVFLACWGFVGYYALTNGDLNQLLVPVDSQNNRCGVDSPVKDKKYLFFFDLIKCIDPIVPITGCPTHQVCVEKCPDETFIFDNYKGTNVEELKKKMYCIEQKDLDEIRTIEDAKNKVENQRCARWYLKSKPLLNRCIWDFSSTSCEYIPSSIFDRQQRSTFESKVNQSRSYETESMLSGGKLFPLISLPETQLGLIQGDKRNEGSFFRGLTPLDQRKAADEPVVQCETRKKLGQEIIMEKVRRIDTYLARFVGNLVAHFSSRADVQKLGQLVVEDIIVSGWTIFTSLIIAMAVSLLFIAVMRWIAGPVIWTSIIGVLAILGYAIYFSVSTYLTIEEPTKTATQPNIKALVQSFFEKRSTWLWISIILSVVFLVIFLIIVFLRKRIVIAIALVKEGSKAVSSVISSVFFPVFPWALQILTIVFAICIGLYLASVGTPTFKILGEIGSECVCTGQAVSYTNMSTCDPDVFNKNCHERSELICAKTGCYFDKIDSPKVVTYFQAINIIGFFWLMFFISGLGDMVLAATFATWYWTFHKSDVPYFTLTGAFFRTVRYHLGTLAFGSLILTICRLIRLVLEYIDSKLKAYDNAVTKAILCCCKCFFWCLEKFLRFMNRNAYIMCAIHGKNFCVSAKDAFNLLMRNFLRVIALDKVTDFLFFLSKLLITFAMGTAVYFYIDKDVSKLGVHYKWVPTIIVMAGTFLITTVFFGVYSMAVDTLFLCFLEDSERNDGSAEKPYFMSKQLMKILGKRNKIPKREYR